MTAATHSQEAMQQDPCGYVLPSELAVAFKASTAIYHVNMSIFRSAPDTWAIGQVLPLFMRILVIMISIQVQRQQLLSREGSIQSLPVWRNSLDIFDELHTAGERVK